MESIVSSVGLHGINRKEDVFIIQNLLKKKGFPHLKTDGLCGRNTVRAIIAYQRHFYHHPDGLVSPGKKTLELLSSTLDARSSLPVPDGATGINPKGIRTNARNLKPSYQCIQLMTQYESFMARPYDDQTGQEISSFHNTSGAVIKGATVGYGHLITSQEEFDKFQSGISKDVAMRLFNEDLRFFVTRVNQYVHVNLTQNEFDAIVMLAFNIGTGSPHSRHHSGLYFSSVLKIINGEMTGDLDKAWMQYCHAQHKVMRGLLNRRQSELNVYHKGVYIKL